jgi:hypothetical protein
MKSAAPRLAPDEPIFDDTHPTFSRGPARRPAQPPKTTEEAEARYWKRYGWQLVEAVFGPLPRPATVNEWIGLAEETRDYLTQSEAERLAQRLEDLAAAIRREDEQ